MQHLPRDSSIGSGLDPRANLRVEIQIAFVPARDPVRDGLLFYAEVFSHRGLRTEEIDGNLDGVGRHGYARGVYKYICSTLQTNLQVDPTKSFV